MNNEFLSDDTVTKLIREAKNGNNEAWQALYDNYVRYIHSRVKAMLKDFDANVQTQFGEDLFQAGMAGFVMAVKNYREGMTGFLTYATYYIDGEMKRERAILFNTLGLTERPAKQYIKTESVEAAEEAETDSLSLLISKALGMKENVHSFEEMPVTSEKAYSGTRRGMQLLYILQKLTDENHFLSKEEIIRLLKLYRIAKLGDGRMDTKDTITTALKELILELDPAEYTGANEFDYKLIYEGYKENRLKNIMTEAEVFSQAKGGRKKALDITNFSYRHAFTNQELDLLIQQVCFSGMLSKEQKEHLVSRLIDTASVYYRSPFWDGEKLRFNTKAVHSRLMAKNDKAQSIVAENVAILQQAINSLSQVKFRFQRYDENGKLVGTSEYIHELSPYHLVVYHENFYCIGLKQEDKKIWHFRVDMMTDIEILKDADGKIVPIELSDFSGLPISNAFWDPEKYMSEHLYMAYDKPEDIYIKIKATDYTILHDWFGSRYEKAKLEAEEGYDIVKVTTSPSMIVHWAMQYGTRVEIINEDIRKLLRQEIVKLSEKYGL